mmetsp:Transcript_27475/g.32506  ORF Transcript_27475/g.32506 Transcript_27475/m.32506 type:complete len:232 (+) Transcript_27475:724-1419(+)
MRKTSMIPNRLMQYQIVNPVKANNNNKKKKKRMNANSGCSSNSTSTSNSQQKRVSVLASSKPSFNDIIDATKLPPVPSKKKKTETSPIKTHNDEDVLPPSLFKSIDIYYLSTEYDKDLKSHIPLVGPKLIRPINPNAWQELHRPQNEQEQHATNNSDGENVGVANNGTNGDTSQINKATTPIVAGCSILGDAPHDRFSSMPAHPSTLALPLANFLPALEDEMGISDFFSAV